MFASGRSFKGLARYLSHDPGAKTKDRVQWTYTHNLAHDDVGLAVDEMLWTSRAAEMLKRAAGLPAGGRPLKHPVRHFSLNWAPDETPSWEHMIGTVNSFLDHMGWSEFQAIVWCHGDKQPHVHVMVNAVHPETGRALDSGFERRRAQAWALDYEREHGLQCEQRLIPKEEREASPTRESWMRMKAAEREHERIEVARQASPTPDYFSRHDTTMSTAKERQALKAIQRQKRENHFAEGKHAFRDVRNAVFREVRTEFSAQWKTYCAAQRKGTNKLLLDVLKKRVLKRQNAELDKRRDKACAALRQERDGTYEELLAGQRAERAELSDRQRQGKRSPHLLHAYTEVQAQASERTEKRQSRGKADISAGFKKAAREVTRPSPSVTPKNAPERNPFKGKESERVRVRGPIDMTTGLGVGALGAFAAIGERLFDGFLGGAEPAESQQQPVDDAPREETRDAHASAAQQRAAADEETAREAKALQEYWERRSRERGRGRDR
jgi:hypothetical protein